MLCDDRGVGWEWDGKEVQEGGDLGIHVADSLQCIVATNTTL